MKKKHARILMIASIIVVVLGAVAILSVPGVQLYFRSNRVRYLANAQRYNEAFRQYQQLIQEYEQPETYLGDFRTQTFNRAMQYYTARKLNREEWEESRELIEFVSDDPELAPMARRMRLRLALKAESTTLTQQAARIILDSEGFDFEAIWWLVQSLYDPKRPLAVPPVLMQFKEPILQPENPAQLSEEQKNRRMLMMALIALDEQDWARAAELFSRYRIRVQETRDYRLAEGMTQLRAGRPELAVALLEEFHRDEPQSTESLKYLAEAHLSLEQRAWAAHYLQALREQSPADFSEVLGVEDATVDPLVRAIEGVGKLSTLDRQLSRLILLDAVAGNAEEREAADRVGRDVLGNVASAEHSSLTALTDCARWAIMHEAPEVLSAVLDSPEATLSTRGALQRFVEWQRSGRKAETAEPIESMTINRLLTRNATLSLEHDIPSEARILIVWVQGFPLEQIWPVVHIDVGPRGHNLYYAYNSRVRNQPLILTLDEGSVSSAGGSSNGPIAISLLNGDLGEERNILVSELMFF